MIIKKEWKSYFKAFLIWTICVAGLDFIMLLLFPELESSMKEMSSAYQNMGMLTSAFGIDRLDIGTAIGFYGMYVGAILSVGGAMFAALIGTGILAKEENGHTAEYLFTLPYSRVHIVLHKIIAMVSIVLVFEVVNIVLGILGLQFIGSPYAMKDILLFHFGQTMMHLEVAAISFLISACTKRVNMGVGLGIALLFYFMDMMCRVLDQLSFCKYITPFYYANAADVLVKKQIDLGLLFLSIVITLACLIGGTWYYDHKDLAA